MTCDIILEYVKMAALHHASRVETNLKALIEAGVDCLDISFIEGRGQSISTTLLVKRVPIVKIEIKTDIENNKIAFDETYYAGQFQALLMGLAAGRGCQPRKI